MSTVILFRRKYLRLNVIIQHCFSLERKVRLFAPVKESPWAHGLTRLLAERRGLTKERLAELAPPDKKGRAMRPAMISKIATGGSHTFRMSFLIRVAAAFTRFDRERDLNAPDVPLWEFFVTDEQSTLLRDRASKSRSELAPDVLLKEFAAFLQQKTQPQPATPPQPAIVKTAAGKKTR